MATYITLVNQLLRRINETELDAAGSGFGDVRNLQALSKDAINSSIREILQVSQEWPFTLTTNTETLVVGTGVYDFPANLSKVDWDTFYIKKNETQQNEPRKLSVITFADYLRSFRPIEDIGGTTSRSVPLRIYQTQDSKFGVTPIPDAAYDIEYRYYSFPPDLEAFNDVSVIPERFNTVVIDGAMMYVMRFRSNDQSGQIHEKKFMDGIDNMRRLLLDTPLYITSTVTGRHFNSVTGAQ
tara:strand:- start:636 stop:1355 length:720 start_codon:yes stop_codon:yes gene_type:complete